MAVTCQANGFAAAEEEAAGWEGTAEGQAVEERSDESDCLPGTGRGVDARRQGEGGREEAERFLLCIT